MQIDINKLLKERTLMETDIKLYTEDVTAMKSDIKILYKERKEMLSDIKTYEHKLTEAEKHIIKLERIMECDYGYAFEDDDDTEVIKVEDLDSDNIVVDGEVYESLEMAPVDTGMLDDTMSYAEHYHKKYKEDEGSDNTNIEYTGEKDDDEYSYTGTEDNKPMTEDKADDDKMAAVRAGKSPDDDKDDDDKDDKKDDDKEDKDDKDDKKDESTKKLNKNKVQETTVKVIPAVAQLFNEALKENKSLNDVKKQIFESKSVFEAMKKIQKFSEVKGNDSVSIGKTKPSDTIPYVFKW